MEMDRNVLSRIKEILKTNPRGMNVTEIAGEIRMNRQSVSKYMEMLVMSGHVDVRTFGPSKVYYLSQRLPVSAMLSLSYDFIIILDRMLNIINVNDRFLEFTDTRREDLMYKNIENFAFPLEFKPSIIPNVKDALGGNESAIEAQYRKKGKESFFNIKFIPMVLDDGDKGITIIIEDITEKKRIENSLKDSEEKFRNIIEQSLDGIVLIDEKGIIAECNEGLSKITGYGREAFVGKYVLEMPFMMDIASEVVPPQSAFSGRGRQELIARFNQALKAFLTTDEGTTTRQIYEFEVPRKDGRKIVTQTAVFKTWTHKGNLLCAMVRDVTELKRAEEKLRSSEERYRVLAEAAEDVIFILNPDMTIGYVNTAGAKMTGVPIDRLVGGSAGRLISQDAYASLRKHFLKVLNTGESDMVEFQIALGGKKYWINTKMTPIKENDAVIAVLGISRDISASRQMEEELRLTQVSVDRSSDSIVWQNIDGRIIYVNEAACRELGYAREELLAMSIGDIDPDYSAKDIRKVWDEARRRNGPFTFETRHRAKDGRIFPVEVTVSHIQFGDKEFTVTTDRDITERKRWEAEIKRSQDELEGRVRDRTIELEIVNNALSREIQSHVVLNEALVESQRTLSTLISNLPGIAYKGKNDEHWTMTFMSGGCRDLTGYDSLDIVDNRKISYEEVTHPDDRRRVRDVIENALSRRETFRITYRIVTASGKVRWVFEQGSGVFSPEGGLIDIEGYITDITDSHDMMAAREISEEKYKTLVESVSDCIWETDRDLAFVYVSPRIFDIHGFRPEELVGKAPFDLMPPKDSDRIRRIIESFNKDAKPFSVPETWGVCKNGDPVRVSISGTPIFDVDHVFQGYRGIIRDLGPQKREKGQS